MDVQELYQEMIIDHGTTPRNFRKVEKCTHHAKNKNPLCGDIIEVEMQVEDGKIKDISFQGEGLAISVASASIMTEIFKGKSVQEAKKIFEDFHNTILDKDTPELELRLNALTGVKSFPARVKCATLAWHTFLDSLKESP